jgi:uncharacterized protein (TIGR00369 family)
MPSGGSEPGKAAGSAEEKPRPSDAEMLARFQNSRKRPPCSETLGMRLVDLNQADQWVRMEFDVPVAFANPTGAVQGGFIAAMLDEAMSTAVIIASNVTMTAPTLEMKTSYLRRLMPGRATVEARILRLGKSAAFMEADCFDPEGVLVARASATAIPMPFRRLDR